MNTMFKKEVKEGKEGKKSGGELFRAALERLSFRFIQYSFLNNIIDNIVFVKCSNLYFFAS